MIQKARFEAPASRIAARAREVSLDVGGGFHGGVPSQDVPPGFSPDVRNFVPSRGGFITPRSALSKYNTSDFNAAGPILGAFELYDVNGLFHGLATGSASIQHLSPPGPYDWNALSYVSGNQSWHTGNASGTSWDYFQAETIYDPVLGHRLCVFTNNKDTMKFFVAVSGITASYSDFTWADSISSVGVVKSVCAINERLVLFNVAPGGGTGPRTPTRVVWSARGNPRSFLIADGAGAEDLMSMRGMGQKIARFRDIALLFTEVEVWRCTPTLDDYAFRFDKISDKGTPWPRTVVTTPYGVVFLGIDNEVYVTDGASVAPLGPVGGQGVSRIQNTLKAELTSPARTWGMYNRTANRYELYYTLSGSQNGFPTKAMFYDFDTQTWWPQTFSLGLSSGVELLDYATNTSGTTFSSTELFFPNVFDSFGTAFIVQSTATNDNGSSAIDARWRSRGLKNASRKAHLKEVWVDFETDSDSSASIWIGSARSNSAFTANTAISLTSVNDPVFVPVFTTDNAPTFELRLNDGGRPRIASFFATIQDASKF